MKRGADNYITKDDASHEEEGEGVQEVVPTEGFRKADDTVLAARRIRALPKRVGGSPAPAPSTNGNGALEEYPLASPKFSGFAGFGSPSNSFTFPTSSPQSSSTQPISSGSPFSFQSSTPTVASTASNTAKTFASFITDSPSNKSTAPAPKSPPPSSEQRSDPEDAAAIKYYTSLRGLNASFLNALSLAVEKDPFADATTVLERYKSLRSTVQKEFDDRSSNSTNVFPSVSTAPVPNPSATPASIFSGFATTSSTTSKTGSFTLPAASSSTPPPGFLFPSPSSTPGASPGTPVPPAATTWTSASPSTPFGSSIFNIPGTTSSGSSSTVGSSATPFGSSSLSTSNLFGNDKSASSTVGSSAPFGSSSLSTSNLFGNDKSASSTVGSSATPFGGSSLSTSNFFGNDKSASSTSLFGNTQSSSASSSKPSPFGSFGGFAKPAGGVGSIGNPVGFVFGNPLKTPDADGNGSAGSKSGASAEPTEPANSESKEVTPQPEGERRDDAGPGLLGSNPHDEEGEGEEQEDTVYSVKLRAFRMKREEEKGGPGWAELGYGVLRLKKHKESEARRVLLRNSSTGRININFILYSGLKPSQTKKVVTFVGHDDGVSQTYSVRLQSEEQAVKLKEALEREISLVKVAES